MSKTEKLEWWQKAVFYQIYPRSFADGNGDGIGDFFGMIDRLDYLQDLGIDALWLSPHFPSPQADCGYDISDYMGVAPEYGTLDVFKRFLDGAHRRGMRVILDLVLNHTSDQHPWFIESRSSRENPKRDWYVWQDGKECARESGLTRQPPNNWYSLFGGSGWEYDQTTDQYYYHCFLREQPDLNWHNPEVKRAMWEAVRFWLDMGVDGFRLDAIGTIFEDPALPDHKAELTQVEHFLARLTAESDAEKARVEEQGEAMYEYQFDQPGVHELMQELRALVDEYPGRVLVGESDEITFYGDGKNELHLVFNFPLMKTERLTPAWIRANQQERLSALPPGAWPCNTLGNHDSSRVFSHYSSGKHDAELGRICAALMLTLRGTPFLYYGEEIGMTDLLLDDIHQFRDTLATRVCRLAVDEVGIPLDRILPVAADLGRDKCRTPMQWADAPNGGFSPRGVRTWLPVNPNCAQAVNVEDQWDDPDSLLNFYRRMLQVRRTNPALVGGDYVPVDEDAEDYVAFLRGSVDDGQVCLVVLNMSDQAHSLNLSVDAESARLIFSSHAREREHDDVSRLLIAPFEVYVAELMPLSLCR